MKKTYDCKNKNANINKCLISKASRKLIIILSDKAFNFANHIEFRYYTNSKLKRKLKLFKNIKLKGLKVNSKVKYLILTQKHL